MLEYLRIKDLALIEDMALEFSQGINVLTGETGAGKSFILKAINFLLGERLTADLVRPGKEKALAEALFALPEGDLILRRELAADTGRSRLFINDKLSSQEGVRGLKSRLIAHTSQHGQQKLLQPAFQARILDEFMDRPDLLDQREGLLKDMADLADKRRALEKRAASLAEKRDLLEFQQQEIAKINPQAGEEEELQAEREILRRQAGTAANAERLLTLLYGENRESGLLGLFSQLEKPLKTLAEADPTFTPYQEDLEKCQPTLNDLAARLRGGTLKAGDPSKAERLEARLFALAQLKRKLRRSLPEILALRDELAANLSFLDSCALDLKQLAREENALCEKLKALLDVLNPARHNAAEQLKKLLEQELRGLGFSEHVAVEFVFSPRPLHPDKDHCAPCLEDQAQLLWRPNPGQAPQALEKIASGGELSRFLLALASLMSSRSEETPTLLFDEVDAGVGGLTLNSLADKLKSLGERRQMLLITHWPQLACLADRHFQVRKEVRDNRTYTICTRLDEDAVKKELARMAGGDKGLALAEALLK